MIALVDYGLGNIQAFANIYRQLGLDVRAVSTPAELRIADKIILPGVGAFDWAISKLNASGLRDTLDEQVMDHKVDVLGVCVGMQMMSKKSEEGKLSGLGWIDAVVSKFDVSLFEKEAYLPHMGWNDVTPKSNDGLFLNINSPLYYFLHSYHVVPRLQEHVYATSIYGFPFAAAVRSENVYGTQFHPEKSHHYGVQLLKNFAEL